MVVWVWVGGGGGDLIISRAEVGHIVWSTQGGGRARRRPWPSEQLYIGTRSPRVSVAAHDDAKRQVFETVCGAAETYQA